MSSSEWCGVCVQSGVPDDFLCSGVFIPTRAEERIGGTRVQKTRGDRKRRKRKEETEREV